MKRVVILQQTLAGYRIPFFRDLAARLRESDVRLIVGSDPAAGRSLDVSVDSWYQPVKTLRFPVPTGTLVWQQVARAHASCDVLVLEHAASILSNAVWLPAQHRRGGLVAFWGHGKNFQRGEIAPVAAWKRRLARRADWWFGYTEASQRVLDGMGVAADRITIVRNTIDTRRLHRALESLGPDSKTELRHNLRLPQGPIFCFVGRMYSEKKIEFLLDAFKRVLQAEPNASLLFVGDGEDRRLIEEQERRGMPVRALGPKFDADLAVVLNASDAMLIPGLVGLVVVDAFCAGLPIFTTDVPFHSPEFAYIRHGHNGFVTPTQSESFAAAIISFMRDPAAKYRLRVNCQATARDLTMDAMVERFAAGLAACLDLRSHATPDGAHSVERQVELDWSVDRRSGSHWASRNAPNHRDDDIRVAVVTNELPPYRRPVFRLLAERRAVRVRAFLASVREPHRHWDAVSTEGRLEVEVLRSWMLRRRQWNGDAGVYQERRILLTHGLGKTLRQLDPHVVLSGGFGLPSAAAWLYCVFHRIPFVIWSEETPLSAGATSIVQKRVRRFLLNRADRVLAWGQDAVRYVRQFGYSEDRITFCPQAVDNQNWCEAIEEARHSLPEMSPRQRVRVVLFVGQLVERKGILQLLDVWRTFSEGERDRCELWIAGVGPLTNELQRRIEGERLDSVRMLGSLPPERLASVYARASLLVVPSLVDIWGLVANEAMAGGIPALVSCHAGAAELILEGTNGGVIDPLDHVAFRARLVEWIGRCDQVDREAIRQHLSKWSIEACEQALYDVISQVHASERA